MGLAKRIISRFGSAARKFDASFYLSHYEDLTLVRNKRQALRHYLSHGRAEGRFGNERDYLRYLEAISPDLQATFDVAAYKFFNKDLAQKFSTEEEFFRHYVRHGRQEGRVSRFAQDDPAPDVLPDHEKWQAIFRTSEFLAWCGDDLIATMTPRPSSRKEAIELFRARGLDAGWPINLEYAFDADFVRDNAVLPQHSAGSDADLYRAWLAEGFLKGAAPNERVFLAPFLGESSFPIDFQWQIFVRKHSMPPTTTRSQALVALFGASTAVIVDSIKLLGRDAGWLLGRIGTRALTLGDSAKAVAMLEQSTALEPRGDRLSLLGDGQQARGSLKLSLEAYERAMRTEHAPMRSFLQGASLYAERKQFAQAFDVLRRAHPLWRQRVEFTDKLYEIIELYFEDRSAAAHELYREFVLGNVGRQTGDALLTSTLDVMRDIYAELGPLPASRGGDPEGYVVILANDDLRQCTHYRIEQKKMQFEHIGIPVRIFSHSDVQGFSSSLIGARAAIFYRVAAVPTVLRAIQNANAMGLDTYYEIDDLIFDAAAYPDPFSSFEGQISAPEYAGLIFGVPLFRYAMTMCNGHIASTPALAERMREIAGPKTVRSVILRNGLDIRNEAMTRIGAEPLRYFSEGDRLRIFYGSGTKAHNADFNRITAPVLVDIMRRHANIDLVIVGHLQLCDELVAMGERVIPLPFTPDIVGYWSVLASCDINLAVLEPGPVADCKSEIKWLEAAVLRIPSVVSDTQTYREVIENGTDGFLANDHQSWHDALEKLIVDQSLRCKVGDHARTKALRDYEISVSSQILASVFANDAAASCIRTPAPRMRILVCNVFFAPQSYGGATRVVEDNIRTFASDYPDMEVAVFCSNDGATDAGNLHMDSVDGIPVYRLAVPHDERIDWTPFNDDNAEPFQRVLDHFQPDLIHFHCIQRLTASIVEVALKRHIPYIVSLHDAWWISDDQFLVDEDGLLRIPSTDVLGDCRDRRNPSASIARRQRLASLLRSSDANVTVSTSFAEIYAEAGFGGVEVTANDVTSLGKVVRSPRADGRIALGHIGGRSAHKGAGLIEAVLKRGHYPHLHLTMVDGTLPPGESVETTWGDTPVTLAAPYPQGHINRLYSTLDVLLAPSTWPESFGLVTREAMEAGLWVVTSNLGAIGEDIIHGHNGYVIDVGTSMELADILTQIDTDPARYRTSPPHSETHANPKRSSQATQLYALYKKILSLTASPVSSGPRIKPQHGLHPG